MVKRWMKVIFRGMGEVEILGYYMSGIGGPIFLQHRTIFITQTERITNI